MTTVTVYLRDENPTAGRTKTHNNVTAAVHEHYLRVTYRKSRLSICYPFASVERWEETEA